MLYSATTPELKRRAFREQLASGSLITLPGAFNALAAQIIQRKGCDGIYISGHMIAADLGLPDIGLTTITEVASRAHQIARMVDIPAIVDADTGFGEPMNVGRSIQSLEDAGVAGCHIEDQVNPKKCGHSDGVAVVDKQIAVRRITAAVEARRDDGFVIIARTDARNIHGLTEAIDRAKAYEDAGADVIFAEALGGAAEYEAMRSSVSVPLMVNLNEFGRELPFTRQQLTDLGVNVAIYPMTLMRLAMGAMERGIDDILANGSQHASIGSMQSKDELYDVLGYDDYATFDTRVFLAGSRSASEK